MNDDERAIRELVATWMSASQAGDVKTVLGLMADDAIFMVPGREPFGKKAFAAASEGMKDVRMEGTNEIRELRILGDWAYLRCHIAVTMTLPGGEPVRRSGYTLTILRKDADGRWRLVRDANLLAPDQGAGMRSTRVTCRVNAPRAKVYRALLDPSAVAKWKVPTRMTSQVHEFDAREERWGRVEPFHSVDPRGGEGLERCAHQVATRLRARVGPVIRGYPHRLANVPNSRSGRGRRHEPPPRGAKMVPMILRMMNRGVTATRNASSRYGAPMTRTTRPAAAALNETPTTTSGVNCGSAVS